MSGMADEMAARMREDGLSTEALIDPTAPLEPGAAAPGTGGNQPPAQPTPPAGAQNTDTSAGPGEPGPVPYPRFKEVNDELAELRGYAPLRDYGYDPDSLSRLAQFEAAYVQDPHDTVAQLVDNLDLPDQSKSEIRALLEREASSDGSDAGAGTPSMPQGDGDEMPAWAREIKDRQDREDQERESAVEMQQREAALNEVTSHWDEFDKQAGIPEGKGAREQVRLALIASAASSGQYKTTQELAEGAWREWAAEREIGAGSNVVLPGSRTGPQSVPRSAAVPAPPQRFGGDIKAATKAAQAAMERGELPTIVPGG